MNIHIMPVDKFANGFIKFINSYYLNHNHYFYLYNVGLDFSIDKRFDNVEEISHLSRQIDFTKLHTDIDKIIIHGFCSFKVIKFLYYNINKLDFNRIILVVWGGDIYDEYLKKTIPKEKCSELEKMKRVFLKKIKWFMTFADSDYDFMVDRYGVNGVQYDCLYPQNIDLSILDSMEMDCSGKTTIQVGNSATFTNQHAEVFDILEKYKNMNIEIICPLSYGELKYRDAIIEKGKGIFGEKFVPLLEYLPPNEYAKIQNRVNIAIFNNNRQQATANIEVLSYLGKKVYLRSDTSMWHHYVIKNKCAFFDVNSISGGDFNDFCYISDKERKINKEYFKRVWDEKYIKLLWDRVLYI